MLILKQKREYKNNLIALKWPLCYVVPLAVCFHFIFRFLWPQYQRVKFDNKATERAFGNCQQD